MLTLRDSRDEQEYRKQIRRWAADYLTAELRWSQEPGPLLAVDRLLAAHGLLAAAWPAEYGGGGLAPRLQFVLNSELEAAGVQRAKAPSHQGVNNLGPALIRHGTPEQKRRFLPEILAVREVWCQGFSETEAGSDLAAVRTTARLDGGEWVVRGGKIWTSGADTADWIYLLVRTGSPALRHRGLSFMVAPMSGPGISVHPIAQITGGSEFSEVILHDVRVPAQHVIGDIGQGWTVAMTVLAAERLSGRHRYGLFRRELEALAAMLVGPASAAAARQDALRDLGRLVAQIEGMAALGRRAESLYAAGHDPGALPSVNKVWWPAVHQRLVEAGLLRAGASGADPSYWYRQWLDARPESIYGGAAQIQRNIIAERYLGLPRSPAAAASDQPPAAPAAGGSSAARG